MKRGYLNHVLFWVFYAIENSLFEFTYIQSFFPESKQQDLIAQAVMANLVVLPIKIAFTYFVIYFTIPQALSKNGDRSKLFRLVGISIFVLIALIFIYRYVVIFFYKINPSFYGNAVSYKDVFSPVHFFYALIDIIFISGIAIGIKLFNMHLKNLKHEKELIQEKMKTELKFLKNQINPHFLFNTLNNIYGLARKKSETTPEIILKLSKLLRFMLYETDKRVISIAEEIRILEDYIDVEKVRFSERLSIRLEKKIDNESQAISPLILLPLIENAFKHGPDNTLFSTFIDIKIHLLKGKFDFSIINSKDESENTVIKEKIGLTNVRRRLELMYPEFTFGAESLARTFKVNLFINLNKNGRL